MRLASLPPLCDGVALCGAALLSFVFAGHPHLPLHPGQGISAAWWVGGYAVAVLAVLAVDGQHRLRICLRVSDQVPRVVAAATLPLPLLLLAGVAAPAALSLVVWCVGLVLGCRASAWWALRAARRRGLLTERALIVGTDAVAVQLARSLAAHPELGLHACGFLDEGFPGGDVPGGGVPVGDIPGGGAPGRIPVRDDLPLPVLGEPSELAQLVERKAATRVLVCHPGTPESDLVRLLRVCRLLPVDVCVVPRLHELGTAVPCSRLDEVWGVPLVPLRRRSRARLAVKSVSDAVLAVALLVAAGPLLAVLAVAIRWEGGAPALFRQVRLTRAGRCFELVKLRTMVEHADSDTRWSVPAGSCTRIGVWLRATHLDELPQLLNVVRGQMSLVGPRPERPFFAARFAAQVAHYDDRLRMPAGITGWAQVHGLHGDSSLHDRVRFDNNYIEYWSLGTDLVILVRTLAMALAALPRLVPARPVPARPVLSRGELP